MADPTEGMTPGDLTEYYMSQAGFTYAGAGSGGLRGQPLGEHLLEARRKAAAEARGQMEYEAWVGVPTPSRTQAGAGRHGSNENNTPSPSSDALAQLEDDTLDKIAFTRVMSNKGWVKAGIDEWISPGEAKRRGMPLEQARRYDAQMLDAYMDSLDAIRRYAADRPKPTLWNPW